MSGKTTTILYIQHAGGMGGSTMSLFYTIKHLNKSTYQPIVALARPTKELSLLYQNLGVKVISVEGLPIIEHCTSHKISIFNFLSFVKIYFIPLLKWHKNTKILNNVINYYHIDIVHLNSVTLLLSAVYLCRLKYSYVWHIRESPPNNGLITKIFRYYINKTQNIIFLSKYDQSAWSNGQNGYVIPNYISFKESCTDIPKLRLQLDLKDENRVLLYLGGLSEIKGIIPLLKAVMLVAQKFPNVVVLMPGSKEIEFGSLRKNIYKIISLFGIKSRRLEIEESIEKYNLHNNIRLIGFDPDVQKYFKLSEFVLFPSIRPHFARPIVEAALLKKACVGSDLGGVNELIIDDETGKLVKPNDSEALASAIKYFLEEPELSVKYGLTAFVIAQTKFNIDKLVNEIESIYKKLNR